MCLLRKITYGEFSEFVQEKKSIYNTHTQNKTDKVQRYIAAALVKETI